MKKVLFFAMMVATSIVYGQIPISYSEEKKTSVTPIENFDVNISEYKTAGEILGLIGNRIYALPLNKDYKEIGYGYMGIYYLTKEKYKELYKVYKPGEYIPVNIKDDYNNLLAGRYFKVENIKFGGYKEISPEKWDEENKYQSVISLYGVEIYITDEINNEKFKLESRAFNHFVTEKYFENMKSKYLGKTFIKDFYKYNYNPEKSYKDIYESKYFEPKEIDKNDLIKVIAVEYTFSPYLSYPDLTLKFDNYPAEKLDYLLGYRQHNFILYSDYQNYYLGYQTYKQKRIEEKKLEKIAQEEQYKKERIEQEKIWEKEQAEKYTRLIKKYGKSIAKDMMDGSVSIGWNKQMCIESWGKPDRINKTTSRYSVSEQWVYDSGSYLYFENGKLVTIQN